MKTMNARKMIVGAMGGVLFLSFAAAAAAASPRVSAADFNQDMRKLWEDHITWTRMYIVAALNNLPLKEATAKRLLLNQTDIGDDIKPFYGNEAGRKLTALLKDHILIAAEVIDAAKAGDAAKQVEASKRWYANSDDIAVFLGRLNPQSWPLVDMKPMLREHLDATTEEVSAGLKKDWTGDIKAYDKLHRQILKMADVLSSGIVEQFPDKFKN
jgi:hypothetical protein